MRAPRPAGMAVDALSGLKQGMDAALAAEKRGLAETGRVSRRGARNGRLKVFMNGSYVYSFELDRSWEPAEDTFVRVSLHDDDPMTASIAISGLAVSASSAAGHELTLEAGSKHPEVESRRIRIETDPAFLLDRLQDAVRDAREGERRLASKAFGLLPIAAPDSTPVRTRDFGLGASQRHAVELAISHEVAYVIGPPGTGKTRTLAATALEFVRRGRSVLITAQTNIAVDNAIEQMARLSAAAAPADASPVGTVVRYGRPHARSVRELDGVYLPLAATRSQLARARGDVAVAEEELTAAQRELEAWTRKAHDAAADEERVDEGATRAGRRPRLLRMFGGNVVGRLVAERAASERARLEAQGKADALARVVASLTASRRDAIGRAKALEAHERALLRESAETSPGEVRDVEASGEALVAELEREVYDEELHLLGEARVVGATLTEKGFIPPQATGFQPGR